MQFSELNVKPQILKSIEDMEYTELTEIQSKIIPLALDYNDLIGQAPTGTGKTFAFAIPILNMVDDSNSDVQAVVIAPTRELAVQITNEINNLAKYFKKLRALAIYGGELIDKQITGLRRKPQIVVATPGRLIDHLNRKTMNLNSVRMVVLDEADEMLNMGFLDDINEILSRTNPVHQTMLFSATFSKEIENIANTFMNDPQKIKVNQGSLTLKQISQKYIYCREADKVEIASRIIEINDYKLVMVFCNTKKNVDEVTSQLLTRGFLAEALHGDMKQMQRDRVMARFREGTINVLVASDVAARGLDIDDVEIVFNFDLPTDDEYYIHRIGRTGRAAKSGVAISFVTRGEQRRLKEIEKYAKTSIEKGSIPSLDKIIKIRTNRLLERAKTIALESDLNEVSYDENRFLSIIDKQLNKFEDLDKDVLIKGLLSIMINADSRNNEIEEIKEEIESRRARYSKNGVRMFITIGRKDDIKVYTITDMLVKNTSLSNAEINAITICDNFSFFEVPREFVHEVLTLSNEIRYKGRRLQIEEAKEDKRGRSRKEGPNIISGRKALARTSKKDDNRRKKTGSKKK